jgi:hypothetical protein
MNNVAATVLPSSMNVPGILFWPFVIVSPGNIMLFIKTPLNLV